MADQETIFLIRITKTCTYGNRIRTAQHVLPVGATLEVRQRPGGGGVRLVAKNSFGHFYNVPETFYEEVEA